MPVWDPLQQQFAEADTLFKPTLTNQPTINAEGGFLTGADIPQDQLVSRYDFGAGKFTPGIRPKAGQASFVFYPIDGLIGADEFTLEYWQKLDIGWASHNSGKALFALQGSTGGNYLNLFNVFSGTATCAAGTAANIPARAWSGNFSPSVASLGLVDGVYNNFAITLKTGVLTFYVNGVSKGTITGVNYLPIWSDSTKEEGVLVGGEPGAQNNAWTSDIRISHTARVPGQTPTLRSVAGSLAVNAASTSGSIPTNFSGSGLIPHRQWTDSTVAPSELVNTVSFVRSSGPVGEALIKPGAPDATHPTLGASGLYSYDWQTIDRSLDWYTERGLERYINATACPEILGGPWAANPTYWRYIGSGDNPAVPSSFASFATMVSDLVAHANSRGQPIKLMGTVNEPENGVGSWAGTTAQLVDLWAAWAVAVRATDASVKIGAGESIAVDAVATIDAYMTKAAAASVPMDYYIAHDYSGSLTSLDQVVGLVNRYAVLRGVSPVPKVVLGEFNWSTINDEAGVYRFRGGYWHLRALNGAFVTAYHIHALDVGNIDKVAFWATSGEFNTILSNEKATDYLLIGNAGEHYAPYNVMTGWKLASHNRDILTTTKTLPPGVYGIATKDPAATKYGFVFSNWGWANRNSRTVNVTISNLPVGSYTLKRYLVDETHSSRWDVAADNPVGAPYDALALVETRTDTAANLSSLTFTLPRWSGTFVTLEPAGGPGELTGTSNGTSSDSGSLTVFLGGSSGTSVTDSFTDTDSTTLTSHFGETGATWTRAAPSSYGSTASITSNRARGLGDYFQYYASGVPNTTEYDISADIYVASLAGTGLAGVMGRKTADQVDTSYMARYYMGTGQWELYKVVAGSYTLLGSYTQTLTLGQTYALKLEVRDATKRLFVNGVQRISSADNAITARGAPGILGGQSTASTGLHLDNFLVVDPSLGGTVQLNGTSAGTSSTSGSLTLAGTTLSGTSVGTSTTTGTLQQTAHLTATSVGTSSTSGTLAGGIAPASTLTGELGTPNSWLGNFVLGYPAEPATEVSLTGTSTGTSTTTGSLRALIALTGTSTGTSTTHGTIAEPQSDLPSALVQDVHTTALALKGDSKTMEIADNSTTMGIEGNVLEMAIDGD